jgi:hypothetical protein
MTCIKKEIEYNVEFAKGMVTLKGRLIPMVVGVVGDKRYCFDFKFSNDAELDGDYQR